MNHILELDSIYLEYGLRKILSSVYVKCETGKVTGLLGRNGSGKSSLLKIAFGALEAESRSVRIDGVSLQKTLSKDIHYLPQEGLIPSFLSISKALKLFNVDAQIIFDVFPEFKDVLRLRPDQLSGGTLRIMEVMMILNSPSKFALLDEPFSGVMPVHVDTLKQYIDTIKYRKGIILTDHLYRHILDISDHLYVLANGKTYLVQHEEELVSRGYLSH